MRGIYVKALRRGEIFSEGGWKWNLDTREEGNSFRHDGSKQQRDNTAAQVLHV